MFSKISLLLLTIFTFHTYCVGAFILSTSSFRTTTTPSAYIESNSVDEEIDPKGAGLGLAIDNAILISGSVDKMGTAIAKEMSHYTKVIKADVSSLGGKVICKGDGQEIYQDPGLSTEKIIALAPITAVDNALDSVALNEENGEKGKLFVNFAGGDDLMVHEVLGGVQKMVSALGFSAKVEFRSLCEPSFPMEKCGVVAVVVDDSSDGQIFYNEGTWYTILEDDIISSTE